MRLHRIRLENFRGVASRELELPEKGVVIVEGPNESGKSSLAEALWLVFDKHDSSRAKRITGVQPVDRDVGVEIEVEVSTGPYRFTYFKRYLRRPETVLRITEPRRETLKGRRAHERAQQILDETIDRHLWAALRLVQGEQVEQAELHDKQGLAQALDRAAGQETAGDRELSLFERAQLEYERYYTPTGRPRAPLTEAEARVEDAEARVRELEGELQQIDDDAERCSALAEEVVALEKEVLDAQARAERREAELEQLRRREEESKRLRLTAQSAQMEATVARRNVLERDALRARHEEAERNREELDRDAAQRAPALARAEKAETAAAAALEAAGDEAERACALREVLDNDLEYHKQKLFFEQLRTRRDRVEAARARQAEAQRVLEQHRVDDEALRRIHDAELASVRAEGQLASRCPQLEVRVHGEGVELDGETLEPGLHDSLVDGDAFVRVPGIVDVTIRPGKSVDELRAGRDAARHELRARLDEAGVADVDAARAAHVARREAQRTLADCEATVRDSLGDLTLEEIREKIERLRGWVERYPDERPEGSPALAADFDGTRDARAAAKRAAEEAAAAETAARRAHEAAVRELQTLRDKRREVDIRLRMAAETERKAAGELAEARAGKPDGALAEEAEQAAERARAAERTYHDEQRRLADARPERVRELAEHARRARRQAEDRLRKARDDRQQLSVSLELRGEKGLFDALGNARGELVRFTREHGAVRRRADAAALLFRTLEAERESARRAYSRPLRETIERLARDVFGAGDDEDFGIELDDELRIRTRTLGGRTLDFDQLSVGAREQLGLLTRLACALLVDPDGGVPVILDDTLGHSDADRLAGMARALETAGRNCQVLVLTCSPERFRIPDARRLPVEVDTVPLQEPT